MFLFFALWLLNIPATGDGAGATPCAGFKGSWVRLTEEPTSNQDLYRRDTETLQPVLCVEAVFAEPGHSVVTESEWSLVLARVVGPSGRIERFQVLHRPALGIDVVDPLATALKQWRFDPADVGDGSAAICEIFVVRKPLGHRSSRACRNDPPAAERAVPERGLRRQDAAVGSVAQVEGP